MLDRHEVGRGVNYLAYDILRIGGDVNDSYSRVHDTEAEIDAEYDGDHFLNWERPHSVWLSTSKPVFVDMGEGSRVKSTYVGRGEMAHTIAAFESNSAELERALTPIDGNGDEKGSVSRF